MCHHPHYSDVATAMNHSLQTNNSHPQIDDCYPEYHRNASSSIENTLTPLTSSNDTIVPSRQGSKFPNSFLFGSEINLRKACQKINETLNEDENNNLYIEMDEYDKSFEIPLNALEISISSFLIAKKLSSQ